MCRISPHAVKMLIRSVIPEDMQISQAAVDKLRRMMEAYLDEMTDLYGEELARIAVQNARADGRHRLMPDHFEPKLTGTRRLLRPTLGDIQINGDALARLVTEAETELLTEEEINTLRRASILRAQAALLRGTKAAVEKAKSRGARRITMEDLGRKQG